MLDGILNKCDNCGREERYMLKLIKDGAEVYICFRCIENHGWMDLHLEHSDDGDCGCDQCKSDDSISELRHQKWKKEQAEKENKPKRRGWTYDENQKRYYFDEVDY
jgi:ribosome-binding protein aMBF1 (putative translation factor)